MSSTSCFFAKILYSITKDSVLAISVEVAIVIGIISALFLWRGKKRGKQLTNEEKAAIIERWIPEPLVGDVPLNHVAFNERIITGPVGKRITINGINCLNLGSHNYLNMLNYPDIQEKAIETVKKYGVGSCGPRGFYGTIDVHLELEERIAKFMQMEESIVYSYGFSTIASIISAYCKKSDVIFVDECVNFAIQKGMDASRSRIVYFKHNDMADLERCLKEQESFDKRNPKKAARIRRFILAEAIYMNTGEMCPLNQLVELRKKYKLRLFLDESISFGTIGANGRGLTEFLNVDRTEVDLICASLENSVGSIGGFSVGSTFIVEHQRLSGLGYCFSASAPPLLAQAAITALDHFENEPIIFKELNDCCIKLNEKLQKLSQFSVRGHSLSPVKHLYLKSAEQDREIETKLLEEFANKCIERNLAVVCAKYLEKLETHCPRPSIRITVNRQLTDGDINFAYDTIEIVSKEILRSI